MTKLTFTINERSNLKGNIILGGSSTVKIPSVGIYARCLHDFERHSVSRPTLNGAARSVHGLPETVKVNDTNGFVWMTPQVEWAIWNWIIARAPGLTEREAKNSYYSLFTGDRAWTNRYGSETCANHILGTNLDMENKRLFPLLGGGAVIKLKVSEGAVYTYETMSTADDFLQYSPDSQPWLFFKPPNSRREEIWWMKKDHSKTLPPPPPNIIGSEWSGSWIESFVDPFPQFKGHSILPMITRNAHEQKINANLVEILEPGSDWPNPFVPSRMV